MTGELKAYQEEVETLTGLNVEDEVLKGLSVLLKKTLHTQWAVIYFRDREHHGFAPARSCGLPKRYLHLFRELPLPPDKVPLLKILLQKKKHLLITDSGASKLVPRKLRTILKGLTLLVVPMTVRNQVDGVVIVARSSDQPPFSHNEIEIIQLMVSHAALVASHIRLFDDSLEMALAMARRSDVIFALDEINKAISSTLSHKKIIETAVERISWFIQCEFMAVLVQEKGELVVQTARGSGVPVPGIFTSGNRLIGESLAGTACAAGESRNITSLSASTCALGEVDRSLKDAGLEALIAAPMASEETYRGVLLLGRTRSGQFCAEDTFAIEKVAAQMAVALKNARIYEEMKELFIGTVATLANTIDAKSPWTRGHSERVMRLCVAIAEEAGLDEACIERVRLGGLLHDIGKIGVIESLLDKPAALSAIDIPPMRHHPETGVAILAPIERLHDVLPGILHHHERYDGMGYPKGLKGEAIPLEARIIAVADAYDAIVSTRPYRKGISITEALDEMFRYSGSQFDPELVLALARHLENREKDRMAV